jgi:hypothetical protein
LQNRWRDRTDQRRLRDPALTVAAEEARDLAATRGMANMHGVVQVEVLGQLGQVVSVMIHVVAVAGLRGAAMSTPIMGDHSKTVLQEEKHLGVPVIG